ncbi:Hsp70 family protein [Anaeromyxobacter soli]|uniref:Hsp70 family protein n=1 Tax=Anaeromyxobacter soli TaxID=2922725 RepID=UPI001FAEEDFE|nr:Hsp70 family protein [Anaeromyxobacter sp. SG29]
MKQYVGIDLGTTNSAICSYDGENLRLWKSPDQNDVTPSAIYMDRRGNKHVGRRAYDSAPHTPDNAAVLFKRLMGSSTPVVLKAVNVTMTPEQCSAEILKALYGYLPEEARAAEDAGTVITVPAAFNQMAKDATLQAAEMAGFGKVALMQEPVAAVMSVMRGRKADGIFVVYDLGGGTLDVAVAESIAGRVSLLAHGGIAMCGGRDFDRLLVEQVVAPWLLEHFDLPETFLHEPEYLTLSRLATWATERAKIELSAKQEAIVALQETEVRTRDTQGTEIYLEVPLRREDVDRIVGPKVQDSIEATRETIARAGYAPEDVERIVFVGGPTHYKPLRDQVTSKLGIEGSTEVNPMTAVAEGAALFAESIDWEDASRGRKTSKGTLAASGPVQVAFSYTARTPDAKARIVAKLGAGGSAGMEFQVDSVDTGWTSGRVPLKDGASIDVQLQKHGEHVFKVFAFDGTGNPIQLETSRIVMTRTAATVDAIPASHSVGVEVADRRGGRPSLVWLARAGDPLPKRGRLTFRAAESLRAGSDGALNLKLWEGEIEDPVSDNRFIGIMKLTGADFEEGVIAAEAELVCEYELSDSGAVTLEVSVPSIGAAFHSGRNFYSRQEGQFDFTADTAQIVRESEVTKGRVEELAERIDDPKLDAAKNRLSSAAEVKPDRVDAEAAKQAMDDVLEAKRLISEVRKSHLKEIRQLELDGLKDSFGKFIQKFARPTELSAIENLFKTAQRAIDRTDRDFENVLDEIRGRGFEILWRQDWFVVDRFKSMAQEPGAFSDRGRHRELVQRGLAALNEDDIDRLRGVVRELNQIRISAVADDEMFDVANVLRG